MSKSDELTEALALANRILDRPSGDPDDDLAMLSRQLIRQTEANATLRRFGWGAFRSWTKREEDLPNRMALLADACWPEKESS